MEKEEIFRAGLQKNQYEYRSFSPFLLREQNLEGLVSPKLCLLLEEATQYLGELNAYSSLVPDIDFFIKMYVVKEASKSSKIEGTKTSINEAILPEEEIEIERRDDWQEVNNYIKAVNFAISELENLPLCLRLLKNTHKILLNNSRGKHKNPGETRKSQNWIGGSSLKDAYFIPPHHEELVDLLKDLEGFWHDKSIQVPRLIKIALSHYQFETIHPFLDGNGRIGRLLITLQLIDYKILQKPCLYLSDFFEKNRGSYYDALIMVRVSNNIEHWLCFFLSGVIETARSSKHTLEEITKLRAKYEKKISSLGSKNQLARRLMLHFFSMPILSVNDVMKSLEISYSRANRLFKDFEDLSLIKEIKKQERNRLFAMNKYLDLFN